MRQIATLPAETAQTFADYLLTLKIQTRLTPEEGGLAVWVCDEDQVNLARQELDEFNRNPADARYSAAGSVADSLRKQEIDIEESYRKRQARFQRKMQGLSLARRPVTIALFAISIAVAVASHLGTQREPVLQWLYISSFRIEGGMIIWPFLSEIRSGEIWRLVTPIFIHFGPIHLLLNMMGLPYLGGAVESRRGSLRFAVLVLVLAVASNLAQYYLGHPTIENGWPHFRGTPNFGGMSGVLYGLFGYMWMKSRYEPQLGLFMPRETVMLMTVWFFLCLFGFLGPVANVAHAAGWLLGMLIGYAPTFWRRLRGRD
jgi:GlpG protein